MASALLRVIFTNSYNLYKYLTMSTFFYCPNPALFAQKLHHEHRERGGEREVGEREVGGGREREREREWEREREEGRE